MFAVISARASFVDFLTLGSPTGVATNSAGRIFVIIDSAKIYEYELSREDYDISAILTTPDGKEELEKWECAICLEGINEDHELVSAHEVHKT